ncbi:MAG TPA: cell division protein CrgA, partial [Acidimicrobiia bacterium]|nr:cell division protein CrgA [Acidimicrobiia bacterium]
MPESKSKRSRYTPPPPKKAPKSKLWVPATLFSLLLCGIAVVVLNYLNLLPGGEADNAYLV